MWFALNVSNVKTCHFLLSKGAKVRSQVLNRRSSASSRRHPHADARRLCPCQVRTRDFVQAATLSTGAQLRRSLVNWAADQLTLHETFWRVALFGMHVSSGSPQLSKLRSIQSARELVADYVGVKRGCKPERERDLISVHTRPTTAQIDSVHRPPTLRPPPPRPGLELRHLAAVLPSFVRVDWRRAEEEFVRQQTGDDYS